MKPYPFASLNHLTVPCAIRLFPLSLGGDEPPAKPRATMAGVSPRKRGEQKKRRGGPKPSRRYRSLGPSLAHVRKKQHFRDSRNRAQVSKAAERLSRLFLAARGGARQGRNRAGPRRIPGPGGTARLDLTDVRGLELLRAPRHLELDSIALGQALEALGLNGAEMHEHVLAILLRDEAIPLRVVEPLHVTLSHLLTSFREASTAS